MKSGGAHNLFFFFEFVVARSFTADGNLVHPTGCEQNTLTRHIFSCLSALMTVAILAQGVARRTIHVSCVCVFDLASTLSGISWRTVKSTLTNRLEMLALGANLWA